MSVNVSDIRMILCVQGYSLQNQFVLREIGYCCKGFSGAVPFNCKINKNQIDITSQRIIHALEEEVHGIKLKKSVENGLAMSDIKAILRGLYHLSNQSTAKYIGICRDENVKGLLYNANLGNYVVDLDHLQELSEKNIKCPSNQYLQAVMKSDLKRFNLCNLHDHLTNGEQPICAKVKAEFLYNFISDSKNFDEKYIQ